jgi:hypothetical protein
MNKNLKLAMDALLALNPTDRGRVLCWFCDACREYVGPGDKHFCKAGSRVWPRADHEAEKDDSKDDSKNNP